MVSFNRKLLVTSSVVAMALGAGGSAHAAQYVITFRGAVTEGSKLDLFGIVVPSPAGTAFESTYYLTYPQTGSVNQTTGTNTSGNVSTYGGSVHNGAVVGNGSISPITRYSLTINGMTRIITPDHSGAAYLLNNSNNQTDQVQASAQLLSGDYNNTNGSLVRTEAFTNVVASSYTNFVNTADFSVPLNYNVQSRDQAGGEFTIYDYNPADGSANHLAFGRFMVTSVSIARVETSGSVPEPDAWAMMLAGISVMGALMRRQRSVRVSWNLPQ